MIFKLFIYIKFFILKDLDYAHSKLNLKYIDKIVDVTSTRTNNIQNLFNLQHCIYHVYAQLLYLSCVWRRYNNVNEMPFVQTCVSKQVTMLDETSNRQI